ncbi:MAG: 50S ribosomal protein L11 methyltransferase, partial [Bacteroidetes bacterium]|nr:50S ribosomal protein L11 methyltransferase [Bacteroidota bacterium]
IHISVPPDEYAREILPAALADHPFEGFVEDDRGIHCYIKKDDWHGEIDAVLREAAEQFHLEFIDHISTTEIAHRNWNEEWERTIRPIHVSDRFIITPSWHPVEPEPGKTVIVIDPKMTFGTGYHETTRLMMRLMEQFIRPSQRVLDVGTGTGILAIGAAMLGATNVIGVDIDEWSLENGIENAERNNVREAIDIRIGSLESVPEREFDVILANIIRNTILELLDTMLAAMAPSGTLLLSGLLATDRSTIEHALQERGCRVLTVLQENDWIAMAAARA